MEKGIPRPRFRLVVTGGLIRLHRFSSKVLPKGSSSFLGALLLTLLNPYELEEQVKKYYNFPEAIENECRMAVEGLSEEEAHFISVYFKGKKSCLVLGAGSGRESLALAKLGFDVKGIDSSPVLVEKAREEGRRLALNCQFEVGDMFRRLQIGGSYDILFLSGNMYSAIPTRKARVDFLKHIQTFLRANGLFYLEFLGETRLQRRRWKFRFKKWAATVVNGNRSLEEGDVLYLPGHYFHLFRDSEILREIEEGGFEVAAFNKERACAVLSPKKRLTEKERGE